MPAQGTEREAALILQAADLLRRSRHILFITGAGLSADSGLPTYRGIGGLYEQEAAEEGLPIEEALSGHMLQARPEISWKYLLQMEQACRGAACNRGHEVIALIEKERERVWVLTQNIDGFHQAAGSQQVIDIHGDIHDLQCTRCDFRKRVPDFEDWVSLPPACPACGAVLRPRVVLFGERLPEDKVDTLQAELSRGFDLIFTIGTTSVLPYIAWPVLTAKRLGIPTVEINPGTSAVSGAVDLRLPLGAAWALDAVWKASHGKN